MAHGSHELAAEQVVRFQRGKCGAGLEVFLFRHAEELP